MNQSIMEQLAEANRLVPAIAPQDAANMLDREDVLFVDVREAHEILATGKVKGALHVPPAMLMATADSGAASHDPAFASDKTIILYCASGVRSAFGGVALLGLGYSTVYNLGGFKDWAAAGLPSENL